MEEGTYPSCVKITKVSIHGYQLSTYFFATVYQLAIW